MEVTATLPIHPDVVTTGPRALRILYAEDLPELRDIARLSLTREGHRIDCVEDGAVAVARLAIDPDYDLVITDHHMPHLDGLDLVRHLRAIGFPGRIMVFSSDLSPATAESYRELHVDRILYKPVFPSQLRTILTELFGG